MLVTALLAYVTDLINSKGVGDTSICIFDIHRNEVLWAILIAAPSFSTTQKYMRIKFLPLWKVSKVRMLHQTSIFVFLKHVI